MLHSLEPGHEGEAVSPAPLPRADAVVSLEHQPSEGGVACSNPVRLGDECRIDAMSGVCVTVLLVGDAAVHTATPFAIDITPAYEQKLYPSSSSSSVPAHRLPEGLFLVR